MGYRAYLCKDQTRCTWHSLVKMFYRGTQVCNCYKTSMPKLARSGSDTYWVCYLGSQTSAIVVKNVLANHDHDHSCCPRKRQRNRPGRMSICSESNTDNFKGSQNSTGGLPLGSARRKASAKTLPLATQSIVFCFLKKMNNDDKRERFVENTYCCWR
ncbi:hypothetical protein YC2023_067751 [Brassica napus]